MHVVNSRITKILRELPNAGKVDTKYRGSVVIVCAARIRGGSYSGRETGVPGFSNQVSMNQSRVKTHKYHRCLLIMSNQSRWYTIRSKTKPSARSSCRLTLDMAEKPMIGTPGLGGANVESNASSSEPLMACGRRVQRRDVLICNDSIQL